MNTAMLYRRLYTGIFISLLLSIQGCIDEELLRPDADAPVITGFTPTSGPPGTGVTVTGQNFSGEEGMDSVFINGYGAGIVTASSTRIEMIIPDGATTGPVSVLELRHRKRAVSEEDFEVLAMSEPGVKIHRVDPDSGIVGAVFRIFGTDFGTDTDSIISRIGSVATIIEELSDTVITTKVPPGASTGQVTVTRTGVTAAGPVFTVLDTLVRVNVLIPDRGIPGTEVSIIGKYFSSNPLQNIVRFNGIEAGVLAATSDSLKTAVPEGATSGPVTVTVNGYTATGPVFTVEEAGPEITSIEPDSGPFDTKVTITGNGFSPVAAENIVRFNGAEAEVTSATSTSLISIVPKGAGTGPVTVTVNGITATGPVFTYLLTAVVNTYAGSGDPGFTDGPGTSAAFNGPSRMALMTGGTLVVAETNNHSIRLVDTKGQVTTLAGDGSPGLVNGSGSQARFNSPSGVAADPDGNIYVADFNNHVIRRISPSGIVSIHAGTGQAWFNDGNIQTASFNGPIDIALDGDGNLYVADFYNHAVRKILPDGTVITLAGNGTPGFTDGKGSTAMFNFPVGLGMDQGGMLYVADLFNHAIRSVAPNGEVTTLAGNGTQGDTDGDGSAARFNRPYDVDADHTGTLYVADDKNHKIRLIGTDGRVSTLAGSGTEGFLDGIAALAQFNDPTGVTVADPGLIFVSDNENHRIRIITFE